MKEMQEYADPVRLDTTTVPALPFALLRKIETISFYIHTARFTSSILTKCTPLDRDTFEFATERSFYLFSSFYYNLLCSVVSKRNDVVEALKSDHLIVFVIETSMY